MTENTEFSTFGEHLRDLAEYDCGHKDYCFLGYDTIFYVRKTISFSEESATLNIPLLFHSPRR